MIADHGKLVMNKIAGHDRFGATQQIRRQVGSYRGNEDQDDAGDDARAAQRNQNAPERLPGGATQVRRSFKLRTLDPESRVGGRIMNGIWCRPVP